jgi:uridylate kinase
VIKATKVDGVYDKDPKKHEDAEKFTKLSYDDVLSLDLKVMDGAAVALCRDNGIEIRVADLFGREELIKIITKREGGTLISKSKSSKADAKRRKKA